MTERSIRRQTPLGNRKATAYSLTVVSQRLGIKRQLGSKAGAWQSCWMTVSTTVQIGGSIPYNYGMLLKVPFIVSITITRSAFQRVEHCSSTAFSDACKGQANADLPWVACCRDLDLLAIILHIERLHLYVLLRIAHEFHVSKDHEVHIS